MNERVTSEIKKEVSTYPVKEGWFRAARVGNALLPQTQYGFTLTTVAAVLNDPPQNWIEFAKSRYTTDQKKRLGTAVSRMHMKYKVNLVTKPHMTSETNLLFESQLQLLWQYQTLPAVTQAFLGMRYKRPIALVGYGVASEAIRRINEVQEYFEDPLNLYTAAIVASHASDILLLDPDIQSISRSYRNIIRKYKEEKRPGKEIDDVAMETIRQVHGVLAPQMHSQFPREELAWIY